MVFARPLSRYEMPMTGRTMRPSRINVVTSWANVSTGMANPTPDDAPDVL